MAEENNLVATTRVQITVEIEADGTWSSDCTLKQIHLQATRSAISFIQAAIATRRNLKIIGEPIVTTLVIKR